MSSVLLFWVLSRQVTRSAPPCEEFMTVTTLFLVVLGLVIVKMRLTRQFSPRFSKHHPLLQKPLPFFDAVPSARGSCMIDPQTSQLGHIGQAANASVLWRRVPAGVVGRIL